MKTAFLGFFADIREVLEEGSPWWKITVLVGVIIFATWEIRGKVASDAEATESMRQRLATVEEQAELNTQRLELAAQERDSVFNVLSQLRYNSKRNHCILILIAKDETGPGQLASCPN